MARRDRTTRLPLVLGGLACLSVGIGVLLFAVAGPVLDSIAMRGWDERPARVLETELLTSRSDEGSRTWRVVADYRYRVDGVGITGTRVGLHGGADNIGSWQGDTAARLRDARAAGREITVFVNPDDPRESVVDPRLRWEMIGFLVAFALIFGGVGIALLIGGWRYRITATDETAALPSLRIHGGMPHGRTVSRIEREFRVPIVARKTASDASRSSGRGAAPVTARG